MEKKIIEDKKMEGNEGGGREIKREHEKNVYIDTKKADKERKRKISVREKKKNYFVIITFRMLPSSLFPSRNV